MLFNKKIRFDRQIDKSQRDYEQPEVKQVMEENCKLIDWKDVAALIIAGVQVLAPRAILFILFYSLIGIFFFYVVAN